MAEGVKELSGVSFIKALIQGAWMAQLVKRPTLDFGSGHDLMVGDAGSMDPAWDSLSLSLSLSLSCSCSVSQNK